VDKKKRGLPSSFGLDVARSAIQGPVQLGDYLEEEDRTTITPAAKASPQNGVDLQHMGPAETVSPGMPPQAVRPRLAQLPVAKPAKLPTTVPRKQVNMAPDTLRMVDELLDYIRTYSVQKDPKASELFHGLVLALYEAREYLDLSNVQPRGRWGTPTAASFPIAIKNAIQAAIVEWHRVKRY
jgi:hypothetical protein